MLAHYLIPLAPFLLVGMNSVLCLFIFLCLEHEMRILNLRATRRHSEQESASAELKARMADLSVRLSDAEERTGVLVPPTAPRSGLNLNKRSQVIRMSRRGEQAERIAASLNLPRREVDLLLKVYSRVVYDSSEVNS